jgi:hypothetical protein
MEQENKHLPTAWTPSEIGLKTHDFTEKVVLATKEIKLMYVKDIRYEWKKLLAKLNILLGGSNENLPSNEELEVMLNYALDNWYKLTLQEIELAVVANISHKTDEVVKFFGKISVSYLQSCITNYETVRRKAILDHKRREEAMKPRTHPEEPDHIRNAKLWAGLVQFTVQNNRIPDLWDWFRCYDHLEAEKGKDWIPLEEKKQIWQDQYDIITRKIDKAKKEATTLSELRELSDSDLNNQVKNACQRFIVERELAQFIK